MSDLLFSEEELADITKYVRPADQLQELRARGFWRATMDRMGRVALERAHYDAVCRGAAAPTLAAQGPQVKPPKRKARREPQAA